MNKPPFKYTDKIILYVSEIQKLLGEIQGASGIVKPTPKLRKQNKIKTIHHSLAIEGNQLTQKQITAVLEIKRVIGPKHQIIEVQNANRLYQNINQLSSFKEADLLRAHSILMQNLVEKPGQYRKGAVGILKGHNVSRIAPPAKLVPQLMSNLFDFLRNDKSVLPLIKACIFHYELEIIHPFADGNGRIGRFWQQLSLIQQSSIFEYLAVETWIHKEQKKNYNALEKSDVAGESTFFIEFSLELILKELKIFKKQFVISKVTALDRITIAKNQFGNNKFSRKDYMLIHRNISSATASRDLYLAVKSNQLLMTGMKSKAVYIFKKFN